ncbi:MAG: FliG C-terminal domain-containing protein [Parvibaculaceae bacterium]
MRAAKSTEQSAVSSLNGAKKAALLLLALGKPLAGQILKHFSAEELRLIPRFTSDSERISQSDIEKLIEEFGKEFADGLKFIGTREEVEDLISGTLTPEQIAQMKAGGSAVEVKEPAWGRISALNEQILADCVVAEHPQTAALMLTRIQPDSAARVLGILPADRRREIIGRMLGLQGVNTSAVGALEQSLAASLLAVATAPSGSESRVKVANIINKLEEEQVAETMSGLTETLPEEAEALKSMLFTFSDIVRLSQQARTALLDKVPTDRLVMALRGTDPAFQQIALSSLAARAKRMVEAELTSGQNPPQREIRAAQRSISDLALAMAGRGEIDLAPAEPAAVPAG